MADAALPAMHEALGLAGRSGAVRPEPLPAPQLLAPQPPAATR
jgi:hypothetical protein